MSIAPGGIIPAPTLDAAGPKGAPFGERRGPISQTFDLGDQPVQIRLAEIVRLQPGDRLLVHAEGELGIGPGGAHKIARELTESLHLDDLGFDVPVVVSAPGLRVEVLRGS